MSQDDAVISEQLTWAWAQQRIWSQTANRLKRRLDRARQIALLLAVATAILAVAADEFGGLSQSAGQVLSAAAAITAGLATFVQRGVSTERIRDWTRARSASEGLKTEVFSYLAGGTNYIGADPDRHLAAESRTIVDAVGDIRRHALDIAPDGKPIPPVRDVDTYVTARVDDQINNYYTPKAALYQSRVRRLRLVGGVLGVATVVLAGIAAAFHLGGLAAWVPVATTIGTSIAAYVAAARYDHLVIEYLRTAQRLEHLRLEYHDNPTGAPAFIDACENAISVENQGWMARWDTTKEAGEGPES